MRKFILILIAALSVLQLKAADSTSTSELRISLLTCTTGNDVSSAFGHSALRVTDSTGKKDWVFNYGTFSFEEPHFLLKFLHGDLNYCLSVSQYRSFEHSYKKQGRGISEQVLNLSEVQKSELYAFLLENYEPQNRFYLYDFLADNCATRIRDIFHSSEFTATDLPAFTTYRTELHRMAGDKKWMMFGIDLILGMRIDRDITTEESMFLPDRLSQYIRTYSNNILDGKPLADEAEVLLEATNGRSRFMEILSNVFSPIAVMSVLILLYIAAYIREWVDRRRLVNVTMTVFYTILGIGGLIVCYMWFGTNHVWTKWNWNLLWLNPLFLIPVFMRPGKWKNAIATVLTSVSCIGLFAGLFPQTLNIAAILLIIFTVLLLISYKLTFGKK